MNTNRTHPPGVATACGLLLALLLIAGGTAVASARATYDVVPTPDGPAVVQVAEDAR